MNPEHVFNGLLQVLRPQVMSQFDDRCHDIQTKLVGLCAKGPGTGRELFDAIPRLNQ
jgi:hypothetical protein